MKVGWTAGEATSLGTVELPGAGLRIIERAGRLSLDEVSRLDLAEHDDAEVLQTAWHLLRDRTRLEPWAALRFEARGAAWEAVAASLAALDLTPPTDDGYWSVAGGPGYGASRAARYAACAAVAPPDMDPFVIETLGRPWRSVLDPGEVTVVPLP